MIVTEQKEKSGVLHYKALHVFNFVMVFVCIMILPIENLEEPQLIYQEREV